MDLDRFVADCVAAQQGNDPQAAVKEVLARAVAEPRALLAAVGEPQRAGIHPLHRSKTLTIFSATWTPQMNLVPHNGATIREMFERENARRQCAG